MISTNRFHNRSATLVIEWQLEYIDILIHLWRQHYRMWHYLWSYLEYGILPISIKVLLCEYCGNSFTAICVVLFDCRFSVLIISVFSVLSLSLISYNVVVYANMVRPAGDKPITTYHSPYHGYRYKVYNILCSNVAVVPTPYSQYKINNNH